MSKQMVQMPAMDESKVAALTDRHQHCVQATAPDTCPLRALLAQLYTTTTQSCGKCVPCANGVPLMVLSLQKMIDGEATQADLDQFRAIAQMAADLSDCAVGYEAGNIALACLEANAAEFEAHVTRKECTYRPFREVPCKSMCPAHVDIPGYIGLAAAGQYADAVKLIRRDNPFPTACALICEHPCEKRCRRQTIDAPINIRGIKKYIVDQRAADTVDVPASLPKTGKKVAIVGGGPSGLTCAYFLALMGHSVTVFEAHKSLGGMLRYGIPAYRFPRERLDEDIRAILSVDGVEVKTESYIDEAGMRQLKQDYDAVYVAIGAQAGKSLRLEGVDAMGVQSAVDLLGRIGDGDYPNYCGKKVVVIGGGNVAMDCARTAVRAGAAEVSIVYRRRREDMTALPAEVDSAMAEGIELVTLQAPARIEKDDQGYCRALITKPQMIGPVKNGRPAPLELDAPEQRIEADVILIAVGQDIVSEPFEAFGMAANRHRFAADAYLAAQPGEGAEASAVAGVYVGGDCQTGPVTAIRSIGAGRVAAYNIDDYLGYDHHLDCGAKGLEPPLNNRTPTGRVEVTEKAARVRRNSFEYVENDWTDAEAAQECRRCLHCDAYGFLGDIERAVYTEVHAKPQESQEDSAPIAQPVPVVG